MSKMTNQMSEASGNQATVDAGVGQPKTGDRYRCEKCGMEVRVTADCHCNDPSRVHFHCCGQELQKV